MESDEYRIMFEVEDRHWWYRGLRANLGALWSRCVLSSNPQVLDVGCGTGANLEELARDAIPAGVDVSMEAIRLCRRRRQSRTVVGSAVALPFPDGRFDVVVSCDVLCHKSIPDKGVVLHEARRVLRPGGVLLLNLPAYQWLYSSHDVHVHTDHRFTRREVTALLKSCGFVPIRATYWNTILFPAIVAVRFWRRLRPAANSDLVAGGSNGLCAAALAIENRLLRVFALPFGLSIMTAARRPSHD